MRLLTAIPVHNEEVSLVGVLTEVLKHAGDVLVVDDGSTDRTPELLQSSRRFGRSGIRATWATGPACARLFRRRSTGGYDGLVTLDCDGQHEPARIPDVAVAAGRRRYRLRQPLSCMFSIPASSLPKSAGGSTSKSRAGSMNAWG